MYSNIQVSDWNGSRRHELSLKPQKSLSSPLEGTVEIRNNIKISVVFGGGRVENRKRQE